MSYPKIALRKFTALFYTAPLCLHMEYLTCYKGSFKKGSEAPDSTQCGRSFPTCDPADFNLVTPFLKLGFIKSCFISGALSSFEILNKNQI